MEAQFAPSPLLSINNTVTHQLGRFWREDPFYAQCIDISTSAGDHWGDWLNLIFGMVRTRRPSSAPKMEVTPSSRVNLAESDIYNMVVMPTVDLRPSYPHQTRHRVAGNSTNGLLIQRLDQSYLLMKVATLTTCSQVIKAVGAPQCLLNQ